MWVILGKQPGQANQADNCRLGEAIRRLGFEKTKLRFDGRPGSGHVRGSAEQRIHIEPMANGEVVAHYGTVGAPF